MKIVLSNGAELYIKSASVRYSDLNDGDQALKAPIIDFQSNPKKLTPETLIENADAFSNFTLVSDYYEEAFDGFIMDTSSVVTFYNEEGATLAWRAAKELIVTESNDTETTDN